MRSPVPAVKRAARHGAGCPVSRGRPCDCVFDQNLPDGETCLSCYHFVYCSRLFACNPDNERCDWSPSRFTPRVRVVRLSDFDEARLTADEAEPGQ